MPETIPFYLFKRHALSLVLVVWAACLLAACGGSGTKVDADVSRAEFQREVEERQQQERVNEQLLAAVGSMEVGDEYAYEEYKLGPGDVIEVAVFQIEELNTTERVSGRGAIMLPLLGAIEVGGKTARDVELQLEEKLGAEYLQDPQVSVFVTEFKSQRITVMGSVKNPDVYSVDRPRSLVEMLSMAGGLTNEASDRIYATRNVVDEDTGQREVQSVVVNLNEILRDPNPEQYLIVMRGGDSIFVPKAGVVFVEGAVERPGAFAVEGEMTVLKALSQAGGAKWEARQEGIEVFRTGVPQPYLVNVDAIRANQAPDLELEDGDIVVVHYSGAKRTWSGFWKGLSGVFRVGTTL